MRNWETARLGKKSRVPEKGEQRNPINKGVGDPGMKDPERMGGPVKDHDDSIRA